jgi:hypothetical protein
VLRAAAIIGMLAGCDVVFRLDDLRKEPTGDGAVGGDGGGSGHGCLVDPFTGSDIASHWTVVKQAVGFNVVQDNWLALEVPENLAVTAEAGVRTARKYDLTSGYVQVQIDQILTGTTDMVETYMHAWVDSRDGYLIRVANRRIAFVIMTEGVSNVPSSSAFDPFEHHFWRISNPMPGLIELALSSDGATWNFSSSQQAPHPVTSLEIGLIVKSSGTGDPDPGTAVYDNFELCAK